MIDISVVVPVYGCRACLEELHKRLSAAVTGISNRYELIYVDDASPDASWPDLVQLARNDPHVVALRLSRNFGQDAAITAGLRASAGDWTVVLDCDLEEPPEEIPTLYSKAQEGFDLVRGVRADARRKSLRRVIGRAWLGLFLKSEERPDYGTLSILSRAVVDAFVSMRDRDREYRLMLDWLGFRQAAIPFDRQPRPAGTSSYTLRRLLRVAASGMFFSTTALLRVVVYVGLLISAAGFGLAAFVAYTFFTAGAPPGYTSLAVLLLVLSGFVIVSVGVVGLYVGRIFEQVKGRPLYVLEAEVRSGEAQQELASPLDEDLA